MVRISKRCALVAVGVCVSMLLFCGTASATDLHEAVRKGDLAKAERLIKQGEDVNARDKTGNTPLHWAVGYGKKDIAELLIAHGADVNARNECGGRTPLHFARNKDVAKLLIAHGADVNARDENGETPLHIATRMERKDVVEFLIAHGTKVNVRNKDADTLLKKALREAVYACLEMARREESLRKMDEDYIYEPDDMIAKMIEEDISLTEARLIENKKRIDRKLGVMVLLISKGADVNAKGPFSFTALHVALLDNEYRNIATWLISQGADVNAKTKRRLGDDKKIKPDILHATPLHVATASGDKDMVELLISKGAKVNARDTSGNTPLDYATKYGYTEVAELLRRHGAR